MINKPFNLVESKARCRRYRKEILAISQQVGALHIAPAFSCLEISDMIYHYLLRQSDSGDFKDTFLMSKGHGCMSQYIILKDFGILSSNDLESYCTPHGRLGAHPDYGNPGIAAATGSLGHGLGMATGMSLANRLQKSDARTFVVLSDGELQEGSTWEAIMMAANLQLDNLTLFLDLNDFSGLERMSEAHKAFYPIAEKFESFHWQVASANGHDSAQLYEAAHTHHVNKPLVVICQTIKGKGVSYMEHVPIWHYRSPNPEEYQQALRELEEEEVAV